jgi:hypothetical protein
MWWDIQGGGRHGDTKTAKVQRSETGGSITIPGSALYCARKVTESRVFSHSRIRSALELEF